MNNFQKLSMLFLSILVLVLGGISLHYSRKYTNLLENPKIELKETIVHDTISIEKPVIQWKTKHNNDTILTIDTLYSNDTIIIQQMIENIPDTFSTISRVTDSNLDATITIQGRGIYEKTFIDSVGLEYIFIKQEVKKNCCWLKRLFGLCKD